MNQRDSHPVFDRLGDFIDALDRAGELTRVTLPVSAKLELAAISDRVMKQPGGGRAVLFEHVLLDDGTRSRYPVAINLFGSMRRPAANPSPVTETPASTPPPDRTPTPKVRKRAPRPRG